MNIFSCHDSSKHADLKEVARWGGRRKSDSFKEVETFMLTQGAAGSKRLGRHKFRSHCVNKSIKRVLPPVIKVSREVK